MDKVLDVVENVIKRIIISFKRMIWVNKNVGRMVWMKLKSILNNRYLMWV